jgi:hypothetical protein
MVILSLPWLLFASSYYLEAKTLETAFGAADKERSGIPCGWLSNF